MLAWLNFAGKEYVTATENADAIALLVLMHWGLLAEKTGGAVWWAQSLDKNIVLELTGALAAETDPLFRASVSWMQAQVSL